MLFKSIFIVTFFFSTGCSSKKQPLLSACLTPEEKADLECFFRLLIFENYGGFVLFGSKPLCEMHLSDEESIEAEAAYKKWFNSLPDSKRAEIEAVINKPRNKANRVKVLERNPYRGWLSLEKVRENLRIKNFIIRLVPVYFPDSDEWIPGSYELVLINVQQTALILAENYEIFKNAADMDFQPLQAVFEAKNPDSLFWKNIFSLKNHLVKGLLFGFGLKNSIFFHWRQLCSHAQGVLISEDISEYLQDHHFELSTAPVEFSQGSLSNFTTPVFRTIAGDDTAEKYIKEKAAIEKVYRGQDIVEVTLRRLSGLE
jgi:hypothetical protein